jgi:hypothetical protein
MINDFSSEHDTDSALVQREKYTQGNMDHMLPLGFKIGSIDLAPWNSVPLAGPGGFYRVRHFSLRRSTSLRKGNLEASK